MNTLPPPRWTNRRGSTLVTAALASGVLAIMVTGFLSYLGNEHLLNLRSHIWNGALHLSEAGIEAGYAELNYQHFQGSAGFTSARGWTNLAFNVYTKTVTNFTDTNGRIVGHFTIIVSNSFNPLIRSVATCATTPHGPTISRCIQAHLKSVTQWPAAMLSKNWINMNGNNIFSDSYDSTDATKSSGGQYDQNKKQANGNLASNGTVMNTLNIGNADIYGVAYTGPGGSVAIGPSGSIGPTFNTGERATTVGAAAAAGWIQSDFNVDVPDVILPSGANTWGMVPGGMRTGSGIGNITKSGTLDTGSYRAAALTLNSSQQGDTLTINGHVNLYIEGSVDISGLGKILINSNASLTIYVGGSVQLAGNGVVNNSVTPLNNRWYGLSTSTSWDVTGNGFWVGAIYAPNAAFSLKGGGANGDMSGGIVANTITLSGQVKFHYDEALGKADTGAGYAFMSWQELRLVNGQWVP